MGKISLEQLAAERGLSVATVRRDIAAGELQAVRIGRRIFVDPIAAATWRAPQPVAPRTPHPGSDRGGRAA